MTNRKRPGLDMKEAFNVRHPMFNPLWRRILVVALCAGWTVFEFVNGSAFFGLLFGAAGAWCAHQFFIAWEPQAHPPKDDDKSA